MQPGALEQSIVPVEADNGFLECESSSNRKKRSVAWDHFEKLPCENKDAGKAKCRHCDMVLSATPKSGTSHLRRHVERCPKRIVLDIRPISIESASEGAYPFSLVEKRGFRQMMSNAFPQFTPFSRSAVRKELFSIYAKEKESVKDMFTKVHGRICLSTEYWKARDTNSEYICVTANFIDDHWKMHRRILCFRSLLPVVDRIYVGDEVAYLLAQWNIGHKTFSITMDGAPYNESLVSSLERGLISNKLLPVGESTLNLIADDLNKIRDLVKYVNKSPIQRKKFFDLAEKKFQLPAGITLRLDVPTRWNSTYKLIECVLYYKNRRSTFLSSPPVGVSGVSTNFAGGNDEGDVFGDYNQFLSMSSKSQGSKSELDLYLEEPSYDLNSDLDVLEFWSKSSMRYPVLALMARDVLSVPVSSATLKSAFHLGGKTLSIEKHSALSKETSQAQSTGICGVQFLNEAKQL
ncbi:hypothetical protein V2J09_019550 [Rumex salicifolius]